MSGAAFGFLLLTFLVTAGDWIAVYRDDSRLDLLLRPLALVFLICVAIEIEPSNPDAWSWFLLALCFSLVGDIVAMFSNGLTPTTLSLFLFANMAYLAGMIFLSPDGYLFIVGALLIGGALLMARRVLVGVQRKQPALVPSVKVYIGVGSAMVVAAFAVGRPIGVLGAGLFYASDALGGWNRFVEQRPWLPLVALMAYQLGQIGLVLSLL